MRLMTLLSTMALCTLLAANADAQAVPDVKLPTSPPGQASIQVGGAWTKTAEGGQSYENGKWIVVDYSRPLLRGRKNIFGSDAEYGKVVSAGSPVWRAGANATTTLTTQVPLMIGGKTVPPGKYAVLVDLKPGNWTLILSSQPRLEQFDPNEKVKLFGSSNYDPKFDVVRVPMQMDDLDLSLEQFTIVFINVTDAGATMLLGWENTCGMLPFTVAK